MSKAKKILNAIGVGATLLVPGVSLAQFGPGTTGTVGNVEITPIALASKTDLFGIINNISMIVLAFVGVLAVLYLIYGGVLYLTAGGEAEKASKGRTAITNAIIGIIIIILSFVIYQFVTTNVK